MKIYELNTPSIKTALLEKVFFEVEQNVSEYAAAQLDIQSYVDYTGRGIATRFRVAIFEENVGKKLFSYPEDWKQAFKERWFPKWLLKKYPVKYTEITTEAKIWYPDFKPSLEGRNVFFQKVLTVPTQEV